jgi:hypothetical protein
MIECKFECDLLGLRVSNTLTLTKDLFVPQHGKRVSW